MKVQNHITIFAGDTRNSAQAGQDMQVREAGGRASGGKQTIYAGNLLTESPLRDRIQQRKAQAQERALKIVGDAWDSDRQVDKEIGRSKERLLELREAYKEEQDSIRRTQEESAALEVLYGVDPDSEEAQDLELLKKAYVAENHKWAGVSLTEEEKERLAEVRAKELTEYQKDYQNRQLELNATAWIYREKAFRTGLEIEKEGAIIRGIRDEKRKSHPMADAQRQAEEVMAAVRDEIVGMVAEEAKNHIDEEQKKKEEEAQEIKEKKEELEELQDRRDEREKEAEKLMQDMPLEELEDLKNAQAEVQQEIQNVMNRMNLVVEDLKGTKVDASL